MTPLTRGLIGEAELRMMKPSALLICFSRGGIIDDAALLRALSQGWIAGAGIDAHGVEPLPPDSPFWTAPNIIISSHNGALTEHSAARAAETFESNLERFVAGQPLHNLVDKVAGY
jgi:phosphoglycerate dehydrogenase-like enzyme